MTQDLVLKIKQLPRLKLVIIFFVVWQYISIAGMAILGWPDYFVWFNFGLIGAFVIVAPAYESLLLLVLSSPFFVVLPNAHFDTLSMWRPLFLLLFLAWLAREKKFKYPEIKFLPWDKYLGLFVMVGLLVTFIFGKFVEQGIKQVLFWANVYLYYLVLVNTLKSKEQIFEYIRYIIWALTIIVTLGFAQLFGTFLTNFDVFWVYWASNITKLYYGQSFANVALYSNSWFSFVDGRSLRMFSIMPDSQSFAYICMIGLCIGTALTHNVFKYVKKWLWSGIRFAGLGLILSGTRAVWVGMFAPLLAVVIAYYKDFQKHLSKKFIIPFVIIFALFIASPFINKALSLLRVGVFRENFIERVQSIYDINEVSNAGRIQIWKDTIKFAASHPFGVGFGNFITSLSQSDERTYEELAGEINQRYNLPQRYVSAHSLYLQILVESGVVGFSLFFTAWWVALKYLWHFVKHYKNAEDFLVYYVAQALLMLLWVGFAAFFDVTLFNDKVLMFFLVNLGLAGVIVKRYHEYHQDL